MCETHVFVDPDFRRNPKTDYFCGVCQRDIKKPGAPRFYMEDGCAVDPKALAGDEILCHVGPECQKKIPADWLVK